MRGGTQGGQGGYTAEYQRGKRCTKTDHRRRAEGTPRGFSRVLIIAYIYMQFPKTRDKKHQKGLGEALELTEDQKVPAILARRKTLSFVALEIDYSRVLPQ